MTAHYSFTNSAFISEEKNAEHSVVPIGSSEGAQFTYSWFKVNVFAKPTNLALGNSSVKNETHILKNVTGVCRPGELIAIMGASGAGKTTLLNVLTSRSGQNLRVEGSLFLNGKKMSQSSLTKKSGYVQQEDLFINVLTVKEQLIFQAKLRMDKDVSFENRLKRVESVIEELGLVKCQDTLIGDPVRVKGISGGEMKRLAFACEVLTDPALLFCDEPTSGIDSFMAQNIVSVMKNLARKGKSIISTIHQPSSQVFAMFDRVLLLAEGRLAYLGLTSGALDFFSRLGYNCPEDYNPADFFISTLAIIPENEEESKAKVESICQTFQESSDMAEILRATETNMVKTKGQKPDWALYKMRKSPYKTGIWTQLRTLLDRTLKESLREPMMLRIKFIQIIMLSTIVNLVYLDLSKEYDQSSVQNVNGCLFILVSNLTFMFAFGVVNTFCSQIPIFLREHFNGMYRSDTFYFAKSLADLPATIIFPFMFVTLTYFLVNIHRDPTTYLILVFTLILVANCAIGFGYLISALATHINIALAIAAPLLIPIMIFGGYFLNTESVPIYFIWLRYLSWFNYGNEAVLIAQWRDVEKINCNTLLCQFRNGTQVIEFYSYSEDHLWFDFAALFCLAIFYRILAFSALLRRTYIRQ